MEMEAAALVCAALLGAGIALLWEIRGKMRPRRDEQEAQKRFCTQVRNLWAYDGTEGGQEELEDEH